MNKTLFVAVLFTSLIFAGCTQQQAQIQEAEQRVSPLVETSLNPEPQENPEAQEEEFMLSSPAFAHNGQIPNKHSCDGGDVIPPFEIQGVPQNTRSLALIMDDPDAVPVVGYLYVHWVVFNIPPSVSQIPEGTQIGTVGASGSNQNRYEGPCPPPGETHRYFFRLYALDTELSLQEGATKQDVETAMQGHILGQTELAGQYTAR